MMTDLPTRLEGAAAGSRELDALLWMMFTPGATRKQSVVESSTGLWPAYAIDETREASGRLIIVPSYTTSIDAAVALAERVLPGWIFLITTGGDATKTADLFGPVMEIGEDIEGNDVELRDVAHGEAATPSLALCAAIIRAHAEQKEG